MSSVTNEVAEVEEHFLIVLKCLDETKVVLRWKRFYSPVIKSIHSFTTHLENCNESLMHFELITFKLLISVDGSVQVGDVDVRVRDESCATIQQRVNAISVYGYGLSSLLLHDWRCRNNLLLELVHEKLLQVDRLRHLRNLERIEDLLDVGRDKLLVSFDLRARDTI